MAGFGLLACCLQSGPDPICGDGRVDPMEECDCGSGASPPAGCPSSNGDYPGAPCRSDCQLPGCGDAILDSGEDCDGSSLGGASCQSEGRGDGVLGCATDCTLDTSGCATSL